GGDCLPSPEDGLDGCGAGTVCLAYAYDDPTAGRCFELCRNNSDCEPGLCTTSPFIGTTFCADGCDPTVAVCPPGLGCPQATDRYICEMTLEEDKGLTGDPCDEMSYRGCADAHACMPGALVPNCSSSFCCTTTCDTTLGDSQCPSPTVCTALFALPAPGFE